MKNIIIIITVLMLTSCGNKGSVETIIIPIENNTTDINITEPIAPPVENNTTDVNITESITPPIENNTTDINITEPIIPPVENNITDVNTTEPITPPIVIIPDTTTPIITLIGDINTSVVQGEGYFELGATAMDDNQSIEVIVDGFVNSDVLGDYNITYSATDEAGNSASIYRLVSVEMDKIVAPIVQTIPSNWYIRIIAKDIDRNLKSENTQLGVLEGSDVVARHSLKAIANPFEGSYLDMVFINPPDLRLGEYKTNFHTASISQNNIWEMTLKSDDISANIEISWRGIYSLDAYVDDQDRTRYHSKHSSSNPLFNYMKLVDLTTNIEIPAIFDGKLQSYIVNMDGVNQKNFLWIVSDEIIYQIIHHQQDKQK